MQNIIGNVIGAIRAGAAAVAEVLVLWLRFLPTEKRYTTNNNPTRPVNYGNGTTELPAEIANSTHNSGVQLSFNGINNIISFGNIGSVKWISFYLDMVSGGTEDILRFNGSQNIIITSGVLSAPGVVSPTFYVNGVSGDTPYGINCRVDMVTSTAISATDFVIGNVGANYFDGRICGASAYDTVGSAAQIQEMADYPEQILPTGFTSANLLGHWFMNEGANFVVYDTSTNRKHGVISGATWGAADIVLGPQLGLQSWNQSNNYVTASTDLTNTATYWLHTRVTIAGGFSAPDGGSTAFKMTSSSGTTNTRFIRMLTATTSPTGANSIAWFVKANGFNWVWVREDIASPTPSCYFNVTSGSGAVGTAANCTGSIEDVGGGWYKCTIAYTGTTTFRPSIYLADGDGDNSVVGNGTDGVYIWHPLMNEYGATYNCPTLSVASPSLVKIAEGLTSGKDLFNIKDILSPRKSEALNLDGTGYCQPSFNNILGQTIKTVSFWVKTTMSGDIGIIRITSSIIVSRVSGSWTTNMAGTINSYESVSTNGWKQVVVTSSVGTTYSSNHLYIGKNTTYPNLIGQIRGIKFYNNELTAGEVATKYANELPDY